MVAIRFEPSLRAHSPRLGLDLPGIRRGGPFGSRAGVGRANITPKGPIWLSGYAARKHASEGVIQDIWAKALVLEDSGHPLAGRGRIVIVTTDLVGLPHELSAEVAERLKDKYGLDRSQIVLNASHTHSGPVVWPNLTRHVLPLTDGQGTGAPI